MTQKEKLFYYTKSGISPVSELMSWYGEIKESM